MTVEVSVIISSYNHEDFVKQAIDSVLQQSFKNIEIIIFDDCSIDNTYKIIHEYKNQENIKIFKSPYNRGMVQNINKAIEISSGKFIAHLNSDDYWEKDKIASQVKFLKENKKYDAVFTDVNLMDENNKIVKNKKFKYFDNVPSFNRHDFLRKFFYENNCLCFPSVLIRKDKIIKSGLYNPAYVVLLDLDMWAKICLNGGEIYVLDNKLTNFRLLSSEQNLGRNTQASYRTAIESEIFLNNYLNIKTKTDFSKIFPEYDKQNLKNNKISHCLIDHILKEYLNLEKSKTKNKTNWKLYKRSIYLKDFAIRYLTKEISNNYKIAEIFHSNFGLTFKKYLELTNSGSFEKKSYKMTKLKEVFYK